MRFIRKYQSCFAACLLAVYSFIATPVSFWHHHKAATPGRHAATHKSSGKQEINNHEGQASAGHCKICDLKYPPYEGEYFYAEYKQVIVYGTVQTNLRLQPVKDYHLTLSNKGPPAV